MRSLYASSPKRGVASSQAPIGGSAQLAAWIERKLAALGLFGLGVVFVLAALSHLARIYPVLGVLR